MIADVGHGILIAETSMWVLQEFSYTNVLSIMFFGLGELAQRSIDLLFMYSVPTLYIRGSGFLLYGETLFYRYFTLDSAHVLL